MNREQVKKFISENFSSKQFYCLYQILKSKYYDVFKSVFEETKYLDYKNPTISERIYHILYDLYDIQVCRICGKDVKFISINSGYNKYCSKKCSYNDPERHERIKQSNRNTYSKNKDDILDKVKQTNLEKYGVEYVQQKYETKEKIKQTNLERYGVEHPHQNPEILEKVKERIKYSSYIKILNYLPYLNLEFLDNEYKHYLYKHNWKCTKCGFEFNQTWTSINQGFRCPECYPRLPGTSLQEQEVSDFLKSLNINIYQNSKQIIPPKELDIYIPDRNIAIEYNGLYYHSEMFSNDPNYHINKTKECEKKDIQLIHIFEDEWIFKQDIVKEKIKQILHINKDKPKIYARNCKVKEINPKMKNDFLEQFHLQGKDTCKIKLGAFYNDQLTSVMTFSHGNISKGTKSKDGIWELNRFCSDYNYHIPGIAGKLLKYFKQNYYWKEIFTYADKRWSKGNLYKKLEFSYEYDTKPNYWYVSNLQRIHRFNLRKKENEPKNIPENILRLQEGYYRIWDCGHMKFRMENK